jgi:hypothetical protein
MSLLQTSEFLAHSVGDKGHDREPLNFVKGKRQGLGALTAQPEMSNLPGKLAVAGTLLFEASQTAGAHFELKQSAVAEILERNRTGGIGATRNHRTLEAPESSHSKSGRTDFLFYLKFGNFPIRY